MIIYLDTSAAAKLLVEEQESATLASFLDQETANGSQVVAAMLLETELRRFATRTSLPQVSVTNLLTRVDLFELDRSIYHEAGMLPGGFLRSLDALHIAVAIRADSDVFLSYDARQRDAADTVGLSTSSPGT